MRARPGRGGAQVLRLSRRWLKAAALLGAVLAGAWLLSLGSPPEPEPVVAASIVPTPPPLPPLAEDVRTLRAELGQIIPVAMAPTRCDQIVNHVHWRGVAQENAAIPAHPIQRIGQRPNTELFE